MAKKKKKRIWPKYAAWFTLFMVFGSLRAPLSTDREKAIEKVLYKHIMKKGLMYQEKWSLLYIRRTAVAIAHVEKSLSIPARKIFALIEFESHWRYWISVRNKKNGRTTSIDHGLTAQNSKWVQKRCLRVLGRKCKLYELWLPWLSVYLMKERFQECKKYFGTDTAILCYNSTRLAIERAKKQARKMKINPKDEYVYLKVWRKHLKKMPKI